VWGKGLSLKNTGFGNRSSSFMKPIFLPVISQPIEAIKIPPEYLNTSTTLSPTGKTIPEGFSLCKGKDIHDIPPIESDLFHRTQRHQVPNQPSWHRECRGSILILGKGAYTRGGKGEMNCRKYNGFAKQSEPIQFLVLLDPYGVCSSVVAVKIGFPSTCLTVPVAFTLTGVLHQSIPFSARRLSNCLDTSFDSMK
jgi:hypothetical protein